MTRSLNPRGNLFLFFGAVIFLLLLVHFANSYVSVVHPQTMSVHNVKNPWDAVDLDALAADGHAALRHADLAKCIAALSKGTAPDEIWLSWGAPTLGEDYPSTAFIYNAGRLLKQSKDILQCKDFQGIVRKEFGKDIPEGNLKLVVTLGQLNGKIFGVNMYAVPNLPCGMYKYWLEDHQYLSRVAPLPPTTLKRPFICQ